MRHAWILAALVLVPAGLAGQAAQTPGVLRVTVTLPGPDGTSTPVPRHALLISDNPATSGPKRVITGTDGTVDVTLRPGSYIVESDRPVVFLGTAYQWTELVEVVAERDLTLRLSADNAEEVAMTTAPAAAAGAVPAANGASLFATVQDRVVAVWSPTARASGFVVDAAGLIATDRSAVGDASSVEVQVSADLKVAARVLPSASASGAAIVWVNPSLVSGRVPLPLQCPAPAGSALDDGDEITTIAAPLGRPTEQAWGAVTALSPRAVETDLRLPFGGTGGPVFNAAGALAGLTSAPVDAETRARGEVHLVRAGVLCEVVSAARAAIAGAVPPEATPLPVDPVRPFPADAIANATPERTGTAPLAVSSSNFDLVFITPPMMHRAAERADRTGGAPTRAPEAEARLGRVTDVGAWSAYFAGVPPVLVVRVTPKMEEGFWKRLAREAARTQGAALPPFMDFKTSFLRMSAACGGVDVLPIHPFVLEHRISGKSEKDVVREGLYVFDAGAFGPQCGSVTLTVYREEAPGNGETVAVDRAVVDRLWQDFAPYRASDGR